MCQHHMYGVLLCSILQYIALWTWCYLTTIFIALHLVSVESQKRTIQWNEIFDTGEHVRF